jgi:two-component system phosphate regulon response regulator PhoB
MARRTILVIEDEPDALELIEFNLKANGFHVLTASTGERGIRKAESQIPDLILLDLMLPDVDGLEVCKILRRNSKTAPIPVIILTARATDIDRILGLELGADDYMVKPFSPRELILRIKRSIKTRSPDPDLEVECLRCGDFAIDKAKHEVTVRGKAVALTPIEFKLLTLLAERRERVQTRDALLQAICDATGDIESRTIDTHMRRLRAKLGPAAKHLATVRGFGYRFIE